MTRCVFVDRDDAESAALLDRHLDRRERDIGAVVDVRLQHPAVIHLVDVIAGQDDHVARVFAHDGVQVLVDGVGGALVPLLADALLRRHDLDELAELLRDDAPALADVPVERQRLVLRGDEDAPEAGVEAVAEDEVDDAVGAAEVDGGFGPLLRQREEPFADAAGEHDDQDVVLTHRAEQPWATISRAVLRRNLYRERTRCLV